MSKSENVRHRKSVLDSKSQNREREFGRKPYSKKQNKIGTLKIFLESENFLLKEENIDKNHRDTGNEQKTKKKTQVLKVDYLDELKSQLLPEKSHKNLQKPSFSDKFDSRNEFIEKSFNNLAASKGESFIVKKSFIEAITLEKRRNINPASVARKESPSTNSTGLKLTHSDYRKIQINEILKTHAQKTQPSVSKSNVPLKGNILLESTNFLKKLENNQIDERSDVISFNESDIKRQEDDAPKKKEYVPKKVLNPWIYYPQSRELETRLSGLWKNNLFFQNSQYESKDADSAQGVPATDTIKDFDKRDLYLEVGTTYESGTKKEYISLVHKGQDKKKDAEIKNEIEIKKNSDFRTYLRKEHENEQKFEEEKRVEKRTTYTDRLIYFKNIEKQEKKLEKEREEETVKKTEEAKDLNFPKKEPSPLNINRELLFNNAKNPASSNDALIKLKTSKSSELRDLVNQAVRDHKIFCIFDNHWYIVRPVREELLNRGWLEVIPDRRLIPRKRPPPTGPLLDRDKNAGDRNSNAIEAVLAAKEIFIDELEETVSKCSAVRASIEKPRIPIINNVPTKKVSDDSLKETLSLFRINPPTPERKKNNFEIREFVAKCQAAINKETEKEKNKLKEKNMTKLDKKSKEVMNQYKNQKNKSDEKTGGDLETSSQISHNLQSILDTIKNEKKMIYKVLTLETQDPLKGGKMSEKIENEKLLVETSGLTGDKSQDEKDTENSVKTSEPKVQIKEADAKAISKIIQTTNAKIHFMWLSIKPAMHLKCFNYSPEIVNKFQKTTFCTKIGLWNHLNNIQWYAHEVHSPAKSPRMYNTGEADDLQAFFQDFQMTACISMLKWLADTFFDRGIKGVQTKKGKVPLRAFEFAIKQCERYMRFKENEDLSIMDEPKVLQEEWNTFLQWFYTIANDHGKLQESSSAQLMVVYSKAVETLKIMKKHWPEIDIDGRLNIWIMKPYCASCGRGIFMTNNVYYIGQHSKYIVQKYIEKPLLIYNTKFDIRQWFMITKLTPLEIWMYKECYLRFCSQPFALRNLHESVHLSNNSVQRKYLNRYDPSLEDQNMWDSATFQIYLNTIGHPNAWKEIIYPGMRDAIVSIMLASQDNFDGPRRNWFEVYGADFMLSSNVKDGPWLIEINENPAMDPSTKVTARLCPQMLRDVIKVIVDKRANKYASTGQWELVYRQNYSPSFASVDLDVKGKKIARVPPSTKVEFGNPPIGKTLSASKNYEVIKCLGDSISRGKADTLSLFKKDRRHFPIQCAKTFITKVVNYEEGKKSNYSDLEKPNNAILNSQPINIPRLRKLKSFATSKEVKKKANNEGSKKGIVDCRSENYGPKNTADNHDSKYKFTKFYKV